MEDFDARTPDVALMISRRKKTVFVFIQREALVYDDMAWKRVGA